MIKETFYPQALQRNTQFSRIAKTHLYQFAETRLKNGEAIEDDEEVCVEYEIQEEEESVNVPFEIKIQSICFVDPSSGEVTDLCVLDELYEEDLDLIRTEISEELQS